MKRIPAGSVVPVSETRLRHFAQWRAEWEIERALLETGGDEIDERASRRYRRPRRASSRSPAFAAVPGRIWLAHPSLVPGCPRPLYLALVGESETGWLRMVPFGDFSAPATDGELLLRNPAGELRVICLWNTRRLPESVIRAGWAAGDLHPDDLADIRTSLDCRMALRPLPPALRNRTGPSLAGPDDPRDRYMEEEAGWLDALSDAAVETADLAGEPADEDAGDAGQLAAEPKGRYKTRRRSNPEAGSPGDGEPP